LERAMDTNVLYYGDNLEILQKYIPDSSIDLVYLDPPFNSKATYNVLFKEPTGKPSQAQITAFEDTWHWGEEAEKTFQKIIHHAPAKVIDMMTAFRSFLGNNDVTAYLTMMCIRLIELRRVLKDTGSIYVHCDPTASHYLRILLDAIFGKLMFQNEIIWCFKTGGATTRRFARKHNIIFFYTKSEKNYIFNTIKEKSYMMHTYGFKKSDFQVDEQGQYTYVIAKDWWEIPSVGSADRQRLGYPTQKPEKLLEKIISASSNEGDIILDPFCGCGTTLVMAQELNRRWIGIDITHLAISAMKWRLDRMFPNIQYKVIGEPKDLAGAKELAHYDKYQFQWWAVSLIGGQPYSDKKKGADTGIDGYLYFIDEKNKVKKAIISVKGGATSVKDIRDLSGVIDREKAEMGIFLTLQKPTKPMKIESTIKGFYRSPLGKDYPKIQILTIEELLQGKKPEIPPWIAPVQTPPKVRQDKGKTIKML
jgi:site-specific DNA-methyltransferase (adenine-specific)